MNSTLGTLLLCTLFGLSTAAFADDAAKSEKPAKGDKAKKDDKAAAAKPINKICPVEGGEIDPEVTVTHKGKVVAFCCAGCDETFKTDPAKYLAIIAEDPANKAEGDDKKAGAKKGEAKHDDKEDAHADEHEHEGDAKAEKGKAKKGDDENAHEGEHGDAEKADAGDEKEVTLNAKCPVSGDDADPKMTVDYKGRTVALCCEDCAKDFEKTPTKYLASLEAQDKAAAAEKDHDHDGDGNADHTDEEHDHEHEDDKAEKAEK